MGVFCRWVLRTHLQRAPIYRKHPYHTMTKHTIPYHTITYYHKLTTINFGELFTLGWIHFALYMRLTMGDKVKHIVGYIVIHSLNWIIGVCCGRRTLLQIWCFRFLTLDLSGIGCYSLWERWNAFVESEVESATSHLHPFFQHLFTHPYPLVMLHQFASGDL